MSVVESYASGRSGNVTGIRARSRLVQRRLASFVSAVAAFPLALFSATNDPAGAESSPPPPVASQIEETNSQAILHAYLQLQEQLHATQLAIEQNRQEAKEAAAQNTEALSKALQTIQETFTAQRVQGWEATQRSNRLILLVAGTFAAMGFLTMLMITYFQWRMSKGLADIAAALPAALGLGPGSAVPALGPAQESYLPLPETAEQREWRIHTQERRPHPASKPSAPANRPILNPLLPDAGFWRRRQLRTWRTALIVGLICAAALALVLYVVTYRKLGFGYFHGVFKM
jgi:hypothetical protein